MKNRPCLELVDVRKVAAAAEAEAIVGHTLPSQVLRAGPRTRTIAS